MIQLFQLVKFWTVKLQCNNLNSLKGSKCSIYSVRQIQWFHAFSMLTPPKFLCPAQNSVFQTPITNCLNNVHYKHLKTNVSTTATCPHHSTSWSYQLKSQMKEKPKLINLDSSPLLSYWVSNLSYCHDLLKYVIHTMLFPKTFQWLPISLKRIIVMIYISLSDAKPCPLVLLRLYHLWLSTWTDYWPSLATSSYMLFLSISITIILFDNYYIFNDNYLILYFHL